MAEEMKVEGSSEKVELPPDNLRPIIEKTIEYVVRNGINFESELRKRNGTSSKFSFLIVENPYFPYYREQLDTKLEPEDREKLAGIRAQKAQKKEEAKTVQRQTTIKTLSLKEKILQEMKLIRIPKESYIVERPLNKYTVSIPSRVKPDQVDLIKLTAQFVARNGKKFLTNLSSKEAQNPEFEFLNPVDPLFPYFQKLVNAYVLCIVPPKEVLQTLKEDITLSELVLKAFGNAEQRRREEETKEDREKDEEEERLQMQLIDWNRFVILETLDFDPGEVYPAPGRTIQEINDILSTDNRGEIKVTLADDVASDQEMDMPSEPEEEVEVVDEQEMDMDDDSEEEEERLTDVPKVEPVVDAEDLAAVPRLESQEELKLRQQVEQELQRRAADSKMVESPFTGDMIPLNEISEHIRIMLLNPKWKEQKEILMDKMRTTSLADNREMAKNLDIFSKRRQELTGGTGKPKSEIIGGKSSGWDGVRGTERQVAKDNKKREREVNKERRAQMAQQAAKVATANRLVPQPAPGSNYVATYTDDGNPNKKRILSTGLQRSLTFHLPNGTISTQTVNLGQPISVTKEEFATSMGMDISKLTFLGPGENLLEDQNSFASYNIPEGKIFVKLAS